MKITRYALVQYQEFKLLGILDEKNNRLLNPKKKSIFLSLGADTQILETYSKKPA